MPAVRAIDVLRPFLWIGLCAFLVGFGGYLAMRAGAPQPAREAASPAWLMSEEHAGPARSI